VYGQVDSPWMPIGSCSPFPVSSARALMIRSVFWMSVEVWV